MRFAAITFVLLFCFSEVITAATVRNGSQIHEAGRQSSEILPPFPQPPFDLSDYPMDPVTASSSSHAEREWGTGLLGLRHWSCSSPRGGEFNKQMQSMEAVEDPSVRGLWGVICDGPSNRVRTISYVCVGGPAAKYVDVHMYPPSLSEKTEYLGWDGKRFRQGPAVEMDGFFWYRKVVEWIAPFQDPTGVFFAKTYRHPNDGSSKSFKVWAFTEKL